MEFENINKITFEFKPPSQPSPSPSLRFGEQCRGKEHWNFPLGGIRKGVIRKVLRKSYIVVR